jgi:hypothetical protein
MVMLSQPEVLSKMTKAQIMNMLPEIGHTNTERLLKQHASWQGDQAKLSEAQLDNDMFKSALSVAGIDPSPKNTDQEANFKVWNLRSQVEARVGAAQQQKGKPLTSEEKREVISKTVSETVLTPAWFGLTTDAKVAATLTPGELAKSSVDVGGGKLIPLSSIPTAEYAYVEKSLRARGITPSPTEVARQWHAFKSKQTPAGKK